MDEKLILEILESKENRRIIQHRLIDEFKNTLISFTLNIPGLKKDSEKYRKIHKETMEYIIEELKEKGIAILYKNRYEKPTGAEGYIIVDEHALEIKNLMINIEEKHFLGRLFDIDVFDKNMKQISRKDLDLSSRRCLLCNKDARVCMREKNHSLEELLVEVKRLMNEYLDLTKK